MARLLSVSLERESGVVLARQRARQIAEQLGFSTLEQTQIATAVSEIARNAYEYADGGMVEYAVEGKAAPQLFKIRVSDRGKGIADVRGVLSGAHTSETGLGVGIRGAQRLMDQFRIESEPGKGTVVELLKILPRSKGFLDAKTQAAVSDRLAQEKTESAETELRTQNRELLMSLQESRKQRDELAHLNQELQDTNRGVVALYAELDERAEHLRRADELKTRFLSNMSHEFRTPLNSILALSGFLLDGSDGRLTDEQIKQVGFIRKSAENLTELVNDLLDLAKVEAGKTIIRPHEFSVHSLFGALRGMLRPLLVGDAVALIFDDADTLPLLETDEGKVSQILRNFISNALKFTERGEVRISASYNNDTDSVSFIVADTGIGIAVRTTNSSSRNSVKSKIRSSINIKGPASVCRCRGALQNCSMAWWHSKVSSARALRSLSRFRGSTGHRPHRRMLWWPSASSQTALLSWRSTTMPLISRSCRPY
jgi:signal transduction histidine kinase